MMRQHFMYPYHWVILVIALILVVYAIIYLIRRQSGPDPGGGGLREMTPLDIIRERYARGEISREDFEQMKKDLE